MTWVQGAKENKCIDNCTRNQHLLWSVSLFMSWLHLCWWQRVMWSVWGATSWVACSRSTQHPFHVGGMHPRPALVDRIWYYPSDLYLAFAYAPFYEDISIHIILDHPIDYGLNRNRGPTSTGPDGLFVELSLHALSRVMINLMCKAEFNWNVAKYFLLNTTMVVTGSGSVVLSIGLRKIL